MNTAIQNGGPDELEKQRTIQQNKCLHKYFECLADELDGAGFSMQQVVSMPIQPTKENVKANIAHKFIKALFPYLKREDGTFSTSDLSTKEIQVLYENMNYAMGEKFGVSLAWPDRFNGGKC